jgi:hypothetical protein
LQEDFAIINQVVLKLKAMEQRSGPDSAIGTLLRTFVAKMGEEQRLNRVGDVLKHRRLTQPQDIVRYLSNITAEAIPLLLDVLEGIELAENRALLCDLLIPFARDFPDAFVHKLNTSDGPQMQRDMVYVLDRANHPDKLKFFSLGAASKNLALRLEVMGIIARGRTGEARKMIARCSKTRTMQVRHAGGARAARVRPREASLDLLKLVKSRSSRSDRRKSTRACTRPSARPA